MKMYIKNVTGDPKGKYPVPKILAFKEDGKKIVLKAGEQAETKLKKGLSKRLVLIEEGKK